MSKTESPKAKAWRRLNTQEGGEDTEEILDDLITATRQEAIEGDKKKRARLQKSFVEWMGVREEWEEWPVEDLVLADDLNSFFAGRAEPIEQPPKRSDCPCYACQDDPAKGLHNPVLSRMIVCPECGNKRCPHAANHEDGCTRSNEPPEPVVTESNQGDEDEAI